MSARRSRSRPPDESLRRKQAKREILLARVEKAARQLAKRKARLLTLESKIAELERSVSESSPGRLASEATAGPSGNAMLIFNPSAGPSSEDGATRLAAIAGALRGHGIEAAIGIRTTAKEARELAERAVRSRVPRVIVAGGDGTVEAVAAEIIGSRCVLGIIPIGTMNNVARSLGVPLDLHDACALIGMGTTRHIDVGRLFTRDTHRVDTFLESAGVGLSAVALLAGEGLEKHRWHVLPNALRKYFTTQPGLLRVEMDGVVIETHSRLITASNAPFIGSNMAVAPDAKMDDGFLDVMLYDGLSDAALIKHFMDPGNGSEKIQSYRTRFVRITAAEPVQANADGTITAESRVVEIELAPRALTVIAGNGSGLTVPVAAAPGASAPQSPASPPSNGETPHTNGSTAEPATSLLWPGQR